MSAATPWWVGLAGVIIGFVLAEGSRFSRERSELRRLRRIVRAELQTILAQFPQKLEIVELAVVALKDAKIRRTRSVPLSTGAYDTAIERLLPELSTVERNCLHVIYSRVRVAEQVFDEFDAQIPAMLAEGVFGTSWQLQQMLLEETMGSYKIVEDLAKSYLLGRPTDVFPSHATAKPSPRSPS